MLHPSNNYVALFTQNGDHTVKVIQHHVNSVGNVVCSITMLPLFRSEVERYLNEAPFICSCEPIDKATLLVTGLSVFYNTVTGNNFASVLAKDINFFLEDLNRARY